MIRSDVYVNGVLDHSLICAGSTILSGLPDNLNTYTVIAVDSSGNQSEPAVLITWARSCKKQKRWGAMPSTFFILFGTVPGADQPVIVVVQGGSQDKCHVTVVTSWDRQRVLVFDQQGARLVESGLDFRRE